MTQIVGSSFSPAPDADGNQRQIKSNGYPFTSTTLTYDSRNKLVTADTGTPEWAFRYDGFGRRVYRQNHITTPTSRRYYIYAGDTIIGEIDDGVPTVAYTWGPDGVASRRLLTGTPSSRFYCYGPQGETRNLTDESQVVTSTYFYEAYGKPKGTVPTEQNPFRYGGKFGYYTDSEIQTLQVGARWYSPHLIRWMSRDPIHYRGGDNLSAYFMGNPVRFVDPSGLDRVRLLVETAKGIWKSIFVKSDDAVKLLQRGRNVKFPTKGGAKNAAKEAWGDIKCHSPHGGRSKEPHFQPAKRDGRMGHAYFPPSSMFPLLISTADFLEEMLNPIAGGSLGESTESSEDE